MENGVYFSWPAALARIIFCYEIVSEKHKISASDMTEYMIKIFYWPKWNDAIT